ncbi:exopolysaccharide biosynthesis polyprenyl glycosylphosphotransferase [Streptomyces sp. NPDC023838]|uniref:exopolysaccharide biosynthesis polyprenyl glycosylphosphotransferase n=1 Tax=Streptomyces sp. NPDC023838 TaxID=3154325 RepID=UPI0033E8AB76
MTADNTVPSPGGGVPSPAGPRRGGGGAAGAVSVVAGPGRAPAAPPPLPARPAPRPRTDTFLMAADGCAVLLGAAAGGAGLPRPAAAALMLCVLVLNGHAGLYRGGGITMARGVLDEVPAIVFRAAVAWCVLAAVRPGPALGLSVLAASCAVQTAVSVAARAGTYGVRRRSAARSPRSALVVGPATAALRVTAALGRRPQGGIRPVGVVVPVLQPVPEPTGVPVLRTIEEVQRAVIQNSVRDILFTDPDAADHSHSVLLRQLEGWGCALWYVDTRAPGAGGGAVRGAQLAGFPVRRVQAAGMSRPGFAVKRLLDLCVALPALLLAAPVLAVCAVLLRTSDGPGVVFRQERVGRDGRPFTLCKFRTLRPTDAHEAATRWSVADDARMSRTGHIMRLTSLDELLNLWNVVRGDMSLVGPRPERPYFVAQFGQTLPGYPARHRMPVGVTGLAQVEGLRGDTSIEDRARYDNYYIDHWSPWQDVCVLLRTAASLVRPTGS